MVIVRGWGKGWKWGHYCLVGTDFSFTRLKSYGYGWWLYDNMNVLNTTELFV